MGNQAYFIVLPNNEHKRLTQPENRRKKVTMDLILWKENSKKKRNNVEKNEMRKAVQGILIAKCSCGCSLLIHSFITLNSLFRLFIRKAVNNT